MSELKPIKIMMSQPDSVGTIHKTPCDVYLKSEADKVISEKDAYIAELKNYADEVNKDFDLVDNQNERLLKIVRHNKYKRCLAMAWWCSAELGMLVSTWESKIKHYKKWHKRWLELAEKFKEVK